ncbi:hypothetical protein PPERSA_09362 [Pseudocohnilembus persalinus]|uniref:Uncharacterized protein n=1 Tax=Pseudocohnilembus persalinus TaxID=266149 RepID=A0A0V0QXS6_PSEPJ|nr:hypothetical protein PPERSA_09362 [Pseudocohnilembus persalinus]|eukprot:KRX07148.1 hypothetical protein PPERSA_09362 [Pseudocohnilembus persalinus]
MLNDLISLKLPEVGDFTTFLPYGKVMKIKLSKVSKIMDYLKYNSQHFDDKCSLCSDTVSEDTEKNQDNNEDLAIQKAFQTIDDTSSQQNMAQAFFDFNQFNYNQQYNQLFYMNNFQHQY